MGGKELKRNFAFLFLIFSLIMLGLSVFSPLSHAQTSWVECTPTSFCGGYGEAVVGTGDSIYVIRCLYATSEVYFWKYDPKTDTWSSLSTPSVNGETKGIFRGGTSLAWDGEDHIYALAGARYSDSDRRLFLRYSISTDTWEILPDTPHPQGAGNALCWSGYDNKLYAFLGSREHGTIFACYDPATNSWTVKSDPPGWTDDGASLVWTGGKYIYALRGEYYETTPCRDFWRYNIETDTWEILEPIPDLGGVGDGASLIWVGNFIPELADFIYALGGGSCYEDPGYGFYRYSISSDTWEILDDIPYPVGYYVGNRLGFAEGHLFYWQGAPSTWPGGGNRFCAYPLIDNIPPTCTITQPDEGTYVSGTVQVTANATDNIAVEKVELYVNNTLQGIDDEAPYKWSWDTTTYEDGTYTLTVIAYDVFGNSASDSITVVVDNTGPIAEIKTPANNSYLNNIVDINITGGDKNLDVIELYIDENKVASWHINGTYVYKWNTTAYTDGSYTIKLVVKDKAENIAKKTINVTVDNTEPLINEITQTPLIPYEGEDVTINATINDNLSGVANATLYYKTNNDWKLLEMLLDGNIWTATIPGQKSGTKVEYYIEAYDKLGNKALSRIYNYTVRETTPPSLEIKTPANNSFIKGIVNVSVVAYDSSGVEKVEYYIDGKLIHIDDEAPYKWSWDTTTYEDGTYTLTVIAYDTFSNTNTTKIIITIDNTEPNVSIVLPIDGSWVGTYVYVNVSASDKLSGIQFIELLVNATCEGYWYPPNYDIYWDATEYAEGTYNLTVVVYDNVNNTASASVIVHLDKTPPVIGVISPANGSWVSGIVNIGVSVSDVGSGVAYVAFYTTELPPILLCNDTEEPYEYSWDTKLYAEGIQHLAIHVADKVGNSKQILLEYYVDNTEPNVSIVFPANGSWVSGVVNISVSAEDVGSGVDYVAFGIYGSPELLCNDTVEPYEYSWDTRNYAEGKQLLVIVVKDKAGNYQFVVLEYHVDNSPPNISAVEYSSEVKEGEVAKINVTVTDARSGVSEVILSYSVDGGKTWTNLTVTAKSGDVYEAVVPGQTAGTTVQFKVIAIDEAGNVAVSQTYSYEVVFEEQPPEEETPPPSALGVSWTLIGGVGAAIAVVVLIVARRRG